MKKIAPAQKKIIFWLICIMLGVTLGLGSYTFYYARGYSYLLNDPKVCTNCHIMRSYYDSWLKSGHHAAASCNDCHIPHSFPSKYLSKAENGWQHSKAFTLQDFHEPIQIRKKNLLALNRNCRNCHLDLVSPLIHYGTDSQAIDCVRCHGDVGHY